MPIIVDHDDEPSDVISTALHCTASVVVHRSLAPSDHGQHLCPGMPANMYTLKQTHLLPLVGLTSAIVCACLPAQFAAGNLCESSCIQQVPALPVQARASSHMISFFFFSFLVDKDPATGLEEMMMS